MLASWRHSGRVQALKIEQDYQARLALTGRLHQLGKRLAELGFADRSRGSRKTAKACRRSPAKTVGGGEASKANARLRQPLDQRRRFRSPIRSRVEAYAPSGQGQAGRQGRPCRCLQAAARRPLTAPDRAPRRARGKRPRPLHPPSPCPSCDFVEAVQGMQNRDRAQLGARLAADGLRRSTPWPTTGADECLDRLSALEQTLNLAPRLPFASRSLAAARARGRSPAADSISASIRRSAIGG